MTSRLPDFVDAPGRLVGAAPYRSDGAVLWGAFLNGGRSAQQRACDRLLNTPCGGAFAFRVLSRTVLYAALLAERTYSLHPRDAGRGAMRERDIGFWSLVVGGPRGDLTRWRLYWLPHFLFVDSASAMASGREVYGYFKDIGAFTFAGSPTHDPRVVIAVEHMKRFDPAGIAVSAPLVHLKGKAPGALHDAEDFTRLLASSAEAPQAAPAPESGTETGTDAPFADALDSEIVDAVAADAGGDPAELTRKAPDAREVRRYLEGLLAGLKPPRMGLPTVLLKQIPDAEEPLAAAHLSIVTVEPVADTVRAFATVRGAFELVIEPSDSHPIGATLGLADRTPLSTLFRVDMDFTVPTGRTLWRG